MAEIKRLAAMTPEERRASFARQAVRCTAGSCQSLAAFPTRRRARLMHAPGPSRLTAARASDAAMYHPAERKSRDMARPASIGNAHESRKGNELGEQRGAPGYAVNGEFKWTRQAASGGNVDTKPSHRERASWSDSI